jgi:IS1 family transposase
MNKLPLEKRVQILSMLVEGSAMRAISRVTGVSINTVTKLLEDAGEACIAFHDEKVHGLTTRRVQCDEIWSFNYCRAGNVAKAKAAPEGAGDVWSWTAIDADSKLIISYLVGSRDGDCAQAFMHDVAGRLANRVQLTTDGHNAYLDAVSDAFENHVDYAMLVKVYGSAPASAAERRYGVTETCLGTKKKKVIGSPDKAHINTSFVESQNQKIRAHMRRFTRLTAAHSKKLANHLYALALYFTYYNFIKIHSSLRVTPAMAAGVADRLYEMSDIVALIDAANPPKPRGPYKKQENSN